ncbi:lamin tail domain-containing protein [Stieleria sp. TO1_6]|uniref:lamin tail domain-containing protein n=1 Tax=Stieleria tagensis TaxID=2956795 RepID=UPI00209B41EC|nr:lamin tail domain-containing protein [Stieleria tagensis]MCO8125250.1 lamin tail domain-containing protein [Stieleria tagensis]
MTFLRRLRPAGSSFPRNTVPRNTVLTCEALERRELLAAQILISEFLASNSSGILDGNGIASDWIEIHNAGDAPQELAGWHLTDDPTDLAQWAFPSQTLAAGDYLVVFASGDGIADPAGNLHTNFKLSASGEYLGLTRPDLSLVAEFGSAQADYPPQSADISFGVDASISSGDPNRYFLTPTPGAANEDPIEGFVQDTVFSVDRGYFDTAFSVDIASSTLGATIAYTTDGSQPTLTNGIQVSSAANATPLATVPITTTTTLRAAAFKTGYQPTNVDTQTYLFLSDVVTQPSAPVGFPNVWGSAPAADYEMDPEITSDPSYSQDLLAGLRELPALSIAADVDDLFGTLGIYANPNDDALEIATSAEYILPDGASGFQIDAGLKIAGGASRNPANSPKHSMSLRFRSQYGDSKLEYDLFEGSPVNVFNSLQLRALYNNSWIHWDQGQRSRGTLIRDQFIRDSLIAAGQDDAGRGNYVHLYLNGLYWGVYNLHERADSSHYAEHNGGDADDLDALNGGAPVDGTIDSWNNVKSVAAAGNWNAVQQVLDVDNFIDWSLIQAYGGNADLKLDGNWRAAGGGSEGGLWRMYAWDSERVLEGLTDKPPATITDATGLLDDLLEIPEFVVRFGDRIQKHFTGDGAFTPAAVTQRWNARADQLQNAIVAESARWGDYRRDVHPRGATPLLYSRDQTWTPEVNRVVTEWFPGRTQFVMDQYVTLGLMPSVAAPRYQVDGTIQSGGPVAPGSLLRLIADEGTTYYTTDGTDPRAEGGAVAGSAIVYDPTLASTTLIAAGSEYRFNDLGIDLGVSWRQPSFDDSGWSSGAAELGFGDNDEATVVSYGNDPSNKHPTTYFRKQFNVAETDATQLTLRLRRDDGAVVYLNGIEIARDNLTANPVSYSTYALAAAADDGQLWHEFDVLTELLVAGTNTIAVEIHQNSPGSSDLSFDAELIATTQTSGAIQLDDSLQILSRTRSDSGQWSAVNQALFLVPNAPASAANLRVTEINYDPVADGDAEYIELRNISSGGEAVTIDLDGVTVTDGPSDPLIIAPNTKLLPGQSALLVGNPTAFMAAYPDVDPTRIVGVYNGKLSNSGERLRIVDVNGLEIVDVNYNNADPWPAWADGGGGSLVLRDPANTPVDQTGKPYHYIGSVEMGGSPGEIEQQPIGVVINEILAHTDAPLSDAVELYNPTASDLNIGGWFLSDDPLVPRKYRIPADTQLTAGGYIVFDESDFNPAAANSNSLIPFALSASQGETVLLFVGDGTDATALADHVRFGASYNGTSIGRLEGSGGRLVPLANRSLGTLNGTFQTADVILSEIHYHPTDPSAAALAIDSTLVDDDLEFIELQNVSAANRSLADWRIRGESDFDFAADTEIAAGGTLVVVSFDPTDVSNTNRTNAFRTHFGIDSSVLLVGPFSGSLSNSHGVVKLQSPDEPPTDDPMFVPHISVDEVFYDDLAPWPSAADGGGASLQRIAASTLGTYADSWRGESPTPGNVPSRPVVESILINDGSASRSSVTQISVQFDRPVDASSSAFIISRRGSGRSLGNLLVSSELQGGKTIATITFGDDPDVISRSGLENSLVDGHFQMQIIASQIESIDSGVTMAFDSEFGHESSDAFFRLFGDSDGDRDVDGQDYGRFGLSFLKPSMDPNYDPSLDHDGDGDVDSLDHAQFSRRFRRTLPF